MKSMKHSKQIAAILTITFLLTSFAGCTQQTTPAQTTQPGSQPQNTTKVTTVSNEVAKIEYWIAGDPRRTPVYQESVKAFMAENKNIEVTVVEEVGDNTQIQQKLMTMIASKSAPGLIHVDTMYVADMARAGTIIPLNDYAGAQELSKNIFEGAQEPLIVDGKIYGYPIRANSIQLVYNKKMFRDAGLDPLKPPTTYAQLAEYAQKLTKYDSNKNVLVYGFETGMTSDPHWTAHVFSPIFWSYGGSYQNADGSSALSSDAAVKTMQYWKSLMVDNKYSPTERIKLGFVNQQVAMVITGEWDIRMMKNDYPTLEFGYATLPTVTASAKPIIPLGGRACVIPKDVKNSDSAWKLLQWVMNDTEQMKYTSNEVGLTAKKTLLNNAWFDKNPEYKLCLNDMQYVKSKTATNILQMNTFLGNAVQEVMINGADIQKSLDAASKSYNGVLKK